MTSENIIKYEINLLFRIICHLAKNKTVNSINSIWRWRKDKHKNVMYFVTGANVDNRF